MLFVKFVLVFPPQKDADKGLYMISLYKPKIKVFVKRLTILANGEVWSAKRSEFGV